MAQADQGMIRLENLGRRCWCFALVNEAGDEVGGFRLGDGFWDDKRLGMAGLTRDQTPQGQELSRFLPGPVQVLSAEEWAAVAPRDRALLRTLVSQGEIRADGDISEPEAA